MKTITLTGMMGSGKTSAGRILAKQTGAALFEPDVLIERQEKCTINEIFENKGEEYFRNLESKIILNNIKPENQIAALGGGAFEDENIRKFLLEHTCVFYLKTSPEVIYERIKTDLTRPLLKNKMTIETISNILNKRVKNYECSHYTIVTDNKSLVDIAAEITGIML